MGVVMNGTDIFPCVGLLSTPRLHFATLQDRRPSWLGIPECENPTRFCPSLPLLTFLCVVAGAVWYRRYRAVLGGGMYRDNWLSEILRLSKGGTVDPPSGELQ